MIEHNPKTRIILSVTKIIWVATVVVAIGNFVIGLISGLDQLGTSILISIIILILGFPLASVFRRMTRSLEDRQTTD